MIIFSFFQFHLFSKIVQLFNTTTTVNTNHNRSNNILFMCLMNCIFVRQTLNLDLLDTFVFQRKDRNRNSLAMLSPFFRENIHLLGNLMNLVILVESQSLLLFC